MVELIYDEKTEKLEIVGITRGDAESIGTDLFNRLYPSGDSVPTGVTGTYDPETGQLRILCPGSDSTFDEVYANLVSCFPGVGVDTSKGDGPVRSQFYLHLNPSARSGDDVKKLLDRYRYDVRLPGEVPKEQDGFKVEGLDVGPPVRLEDVLDGLEIVTK